MLLEQASSDVEEGVEGEFVDDVGDSLCGNCRLGRVHLNPRLVINAHRPLNHSTLGLRVIKRKRCPPD